MGWILVRALRQIRLETIFDVPALVNRVVHAGSKQVAPQSECFQPSPGPSGSDPLHRSRGSVSYAVHFAWVGLQPNAKRAGGVGTKPPKHAPEQPPADTRFDALPAKTIDFWENLRSFL
jgi:hypothetical protein